MWRRQVTHVSICSSNFYRSWHFSVLGTVDRRRYAEVWLTSTDIQSSSITPRDGPRHIPLHGLSAWTSVHDPTDVSPSVVVTQHLPYNQQRVTRFVAMGYACNDTNRVTLCTLLITRVDSSSSWERPFWFGLWVVLADVWRSDRVDTRKKSPPQQWNVCFVVRRLTARHFAIFPYQPKRHEYHKTVCPWRISSMQKPTTTTAARRKETVRRTTTTTKSIQELHHQRQIHRRIRRFTSRHMVVKWMLVIRI